MDSKFTKETVSKEYNWLNPKILDSNLCLVIGDDIDSLLSAALWNSVSKRDWKIIGVYHQYSKLVVNKDYLDELENAVWLDLDICRPGIRSVGHHILEDKDNNILFPNTNGFNLNRYRGIDHQQFKRKYPLGTVHFLMWLFDVAVPKCEFAREMILSTDSAWINGQEGRFPENVKDWIENCIPLPDLRDAFNELNDRGFEKNMMRYFGYLEHNGINSPDGQVKSRHFKIAGKQCQFDPQKTHQINRISRLIENVTGWEMPVVEFADNQAVNSGDRKQYKQKNILRKIEKYGSFRKWIEAEKIFSYVFTYNHTMNCTKGVIF